MVEHKTPEQVIAEERKARGLEDGYPVYVWHPEYAPVHPCACDSQAALDTLLTQGWSTSREAMLTSATTDASVAPSAAAGDPVDAMVEEETRNDRTTRTTKRKTK